ncbi:uncharacterized protein LOC106473942 [Limulus polyphemus]|uniref:Uncharacterized protein LOC106473942 n=1 Tax=Limulus polyphemus TaxID=6850 RepID=A0ABM1TQ84_LIMPO|nr:uncharacterized protein LOC106473942 [Limulus polyphemus]
MPGLNVWQKPIKMSLCMNKTHTDIGCCPVDLSISDKVYVDDQSRTTGDYYLYVPFRVFRFLDGSRVSFSCNVIICQDNCPSADCGEFMGMSYGRKKRDITDNSRYQVMSVSRDVTVLDDVTSRTVHAKTTSIEKLEDSKTETAALSVHFTWLLGGATIATTLFFSLALNVYFIFIAKRNSSVSEKTNEHGKTDCCSSLKTRKTEINYPPRRTQRPLFD